MDPVDPLILIFTCFQKALVNIIKNILKYKTRSDLTSSAHYLKLSLKSKTDFVTLYIFPSKKQFVYNNIIKQPGYKEACYYPLPREKSIKIALKIF